MKKLIRNTIIVVVLLVVVAVAAVIFFLDSIVKKGIETVGPSVTKVPVTVQSVHVSILGGSGKIKGLVVGNPAGYQTPHSISIGSASMALKIGSIRSEKIIIKSIELKEPEIVFEQTLKGNNLLDLLHNVEGDSTGGTAPAPTTPAPAPTPAQSAQKFQVDDFLISGAKVQASAQGMAGKTVPVTIPDIHLTNLGTGEGITADQLVAEVLRALEREVVKVGTEALKKAGSDYVKKEGGKLLDDAKDKASKGLNDLLKKK